MDKKNEQGYIIGGKRYTPEKSVVLCRVGDNLETVTLYQTPKGAFFTVREGMGQEAPAVDVLDRDGALDFMDAHPAGIDPAAYVKAFGEPVEG